MRRTRSVWLIVFFYIFSVWRRLDRVEHELKEIIGRSPAGGPAVNFSEMTSAHFIFIPAVLLIGVVIGWILGSRAAADAFQAELRRREERGARKGG